MYIAELRIPCEEKERRYDKFIGLFEKIEDAYCNAEKMINMMFPDNEGWKCENTSYIVYGPWRKTHEVKLTVYHISSLDFESYMLMKHDVE